MLGQGPGVVMVSEELKGAVLALATADRTLSEDAKMLILGVVGQVG